jgi:TonB family protein
MSIKYLFFLLFAAIPLTLFAQSTNDVHEYAEVMPQFVGGEEAMNSFISKHLQYPKAAVDSNIEGKVWIRFIVNKNGTLTSPEVVKSPSSILSAAALQVIEKMPVWSPGTINGLPVAVKTTMPISFQLLQIPEDSPYPTMRGGDFGDFVQENFVYPEKALKDTVGGVVLMDFTVNKDGRLTNFKVRKSPNRLFDKELIRLADLTYWIPAVKNGKPIDYDCRVSLHLSPYRKYHPDTRQGLFMHVEDSTVSELPSFSGGMAMYLMYLVEHNHLHLSNSSPDFYAEEVVTMKVSMNGELSDVKIRKSIGKAFDDETYRLVKEMKPWKPAMKNGKATDCYVWLKVPYTKKQ